MICTLTYLSLNSTQIEDIPKELNSLCINISTDISRIIKAGSMKVQTDPFKLLSKILK